MALSAKAHFIASRPCHNASNLLLPVSSTRILAFQSAQRSATTTAAHRQASRHTAATGRLQTPRAAVTEQVITMGQAAVPKTLNAFLAESAPGQQELLLLFNALQTATKLIAGKVARAGIEDLYGYSGDQESSGADRDKQKKLDVVANDIMKAVLTSCGQASVMASEEDDEAVVVQGSSGPYVVVFDPLDGSRNIDAAIPTGTIFGVYKRNPATDPTSDVLQPGSCLVAAGYSLYSSATMMVITTGSGTHGFTLDPLLGDFVLTHHNITIPRRGQIYSVNDARYFDWPKGLQQYIDTIRQGKGQHPKQYSARYICSLVADFHRTLLYGGVAMNPRSHLRLVYEANPMSFLCEQAGGKGSDGKQRIMDIRPGKLHQRLPLFLGSPDDIEELESYGDVQQVSKKTYDV